MYRKLGLIALVIVGTGLPFAVFEGVLRTFPELISTPVLLEYPRPLKREIATRLGLPVKQARRGISPEERHDNGPELCLAQPGFLWVQKFDAVDGEYGAVEQLPQDANGFCNTAEKARRTHNPIIVIGDSFTWCWNVPSETTATARLEHILQSNSYNLGFPGIGPYEYIEILKRSGLKYSPTLVIMNIYEGNDLRDGVRFWKGKQKSKAAGELASDGLDKSPKESSFLKGIISGSYSLNFVVASIELVGKQLLTDDTDFHYSVTVENRTIGMNVTNADRDEVKTARQLRKGEVSPSAWHDALAEFVALSEKNRFTPIVVYIPSAHTAYSAGVVFEDSKVGQDVRLLSTTQRDYLSRISTELGFTFLDLATDLQAAVASGPLAYFPGSLHLTEHGHELVAKLLSRQISGVLAAQDANQ